MSLGEGGGQEVAFETREPEGDIPIPQRDLGDLGNLSAVFFPLTVAMKWSRCSGRVPGR
jgi:hypothetical protein